MSTPLFPDFTDDGDRIQPTSLATMHRMYGRKDGHCCGTCKHLYRKHFDNTYLKCDLTVDTHGPASDWRAKWDACGRWEHKAE